MATLIYSPGVKLSIATRKHGVIDVSQDLVDGTVELNQDQMHHMEVRVSNPGNKYLGIFSPNDRFVVAMRRVRWVQVMAGYLNTVPVFSSETRTVPLSGFCTLKKLFFTFWDPGAEASLNLVNQALHDTGASSWTQEEAGLPTVTMRLLSEVAGWDPQRIHMGQVPRAWLDRASSLLTRLSDRIQFNYNIIGGGATIGGGNADTVGNLRLPALVGHDTTTGFLRDTSGLATHYVGRIGALQPLTAGTAEDPSGAWYCAASFPYVNRDGSGPQDGAAKQWWAGKRLLVLNVNNQKAVIVRAADFEQASAFDPQKIIDLSNPAFEAIAGPGGLGLGVLPVQVRFAPSQATPLGPYAMPSGQGATGIGSSPTGASPSTPAAPKVTGVPSAGDLLTLARTQLGKPYVYASQPSGSIADPRSFDCSGFVRWLCMRLNVPIPGGAAGFTPSDKQLHAQPIPVAQATKTPGALLGHYGSGPNGHVVISMGDGNVIQAPHTGDVVKISPVSASYTAGGLIPGLVYDGSTGVGGAGGLGRGGASTGPFNFSSLFADQISQESQLLTGIRALLNDEQLMPTISRFMLASQRHYCSAPNGDFISWFGDYFDSYGILGRMDVQPIEIQKGWTMMWDDQSLKTHIFTAGSALGYATGGGGIESIPGGFVDPQLLATTAGIASVDFPEIIDALVGVQPEGSPFKDRETILDRFSARPHFEPMPNIKIGEAEFFFALRMLAMNWSDQFSTHVPLTFMPELFPGMLLRLPHAKFQCYVNSVTHNFSMEPGGGFTTTCTVSSPSNTSGGGIWTGLVQKGQV
jgi:cell wall-associated NlpC family hydrolase